jgi:hypothetical protein
MMRPVQPALEGLSGLERGFVVGMALAGGRPAAATRLAGPGAARCAAALRALGADADQARAAALTALAEVIGPPVPVGIERVHPGWIRRALAGERSPIVRALAAGLAPAVAGVAAEILAARGEDVAAAPPDAPAGVVAALGRAVFGALAPMPPAADGVAPEVRTLCDLAAPALLETIDRRGAVVLGASLAGAPARVLAEAAAGAGEPLGAVVLEAARGDVAPDVRAAARALVAAAGRDVAARALGVVRALGLRAIALDLERCGASADGAAAVAQRLPPALGEALLALFSDEEAC